MIYRDQINNTITLPHTPKRIISLVPSQTELLYDLGLDEEVIGITKFCIHPDKWFRSKQRVGGTKNINIPLITSLQPDLIIANKEENVKEQIEALHPVAPVWVSDVNNIEEALDMIGTIGSMTGKKLQADEMIKNIGHSFEELKAVPENLQQEPRKVAYLIWKDPYMAAGNDTFINDMIEKCGWQNVLQQNRYPEVTLPELIALKTDIILLSSEPYPFRQKHIDSIREQMPGCKIYLVDGEMFSWYGSRMLRAPQYFKTLIKQFSSPQ